MKTYKKLVIILITVVLISIIFISAFLIISLNNKTFNYDFFSMDTVISQNLRGDNFQNTIDAAKAVENEFIKLENVFSSHKSNSEISQINLLKKDIKLKLNDEVFDVLKLSFDLCRKSDGIFDVSVKPIADLWDITSEYPTVPSEESIKSALSLVSYENFVLTDDKFIYKTKSEACLDLGGILKGYAIEKAKIIYIDYKIKSGFISVGGNIFNIGKKENGDKFLFGIKRPNPDATDYIGTISAEGKAISTSGAYERYFIKDDKLYHHIFDTKNGNPVDSDFLSCIAICENATYADFLSTYLFCLPMERAKVLLNGNNFSAILIDKNQNIYISNDIKNSFNITDDQYKIML